MGRAIPMMLAAAGTALALAACGGSSGSGSGSSATTTTAADAGRQLFASVGCASCHTLKAAGANGSVGPNLDRVKPSEARVVHQVTNGGGGMPAFKEQLTAGQIRAVARYVAGVAGG